MRTERETGEVIMTASEERIERERMDETRRADTAEQRVEELEIGLVFAEKRFLEIRANCDLALAEINDARREAHRRN